MERHTAESLAASLRAARGLYEPVDQPRPFRSEILLDEELNPSCETFSEDVRDALVEASLAEDIGEPEAYSAKIAAVQAWSLAQIECGADDTLQTQVERPIYLV